MGEQPTATDLGEGVWRLAYPTPETMNGAASEGVLRPLVEASRAGPLVIIAVLPPEVRLVPPGLVSFWLTHFTRGGIHLAAAAVVSRSLAVKVALSGFGSAMSLSQRPVQFGTFPSFEEALAWAHTKRPR